MGSDWKENYCEYELQECMEAIIDYRGKTPKKTSSGIPLITAKIVKNGRLETFNEFIACEDYDAWMTRGLPQAGDVVLTTEAPLGEVAQLDNTKVALAQRIVTLRGKKHILDNDYLLYLLQDSYYQHQLDSKSSGSTVKGIKQSELRKIKLFLPPLAEQKSIASILSSLDEKIENNNAINKNLEEQAQAIFKSWFVDFEPFGGVMPHDWQIGTVGDIIEIHDSKRIPLSGNIRAKMSIRTYPYYGAASLMDYVENYIFDGIYLLLGEDGTVIDEFGLPILQYVWGKFWVNNHAHVLTGKRGFKVETLYLFFKRTPVLSAVTGAVQPKISQGNLRSLEAIIPTEVILETFTNIVAPIFENVRLLNEENRCLTKLRDSLLPKLMSGAVRVPVEVE